MTRRITLLLMVGLLLVACSKQAPEQAPGTAVIANIKTSLRAVGIAISTTKATLPLLKLDADDQKTANGILADILTARDSLQSRLAPYTHFDSTNSEEIKQAAKDAIATLSDLNDKGVTHIKNENARMAVSGALIALQEAVFAVLELKAPAAS